MNALYYQPHNGVYAHGGLNMQTNVAVEGLFFLNLDTFVWSHLTQGPQYKIEGDIGAHVSYTSRMLFDLNLSHFCEQLGRANINRHNIVPI